MRYNVYLAIGVTAESEEEARKIVERVLDVEIPTVVDGYTIDETLPIVGGE